MEPIRNDIFRMVSIRGSSDDVVVDPHDDGEVEDVDGPVVLRLREVDFNVTPTLLKELDSSLDGLDLDGAGKRLVHLEEQIAAGGTSAISYDDGEYDLRSLREAPLFRRDFAAMYNFWLLRRLQAAPPEILQPTAVQIAAGLVVYKLIAPGRRGTLKIVLPEKLRRRRTAEKAALADEKLKKTYSEPGKIDERIAELEAAEADLKAISEIEHGLQAGLTSQFQPVARQVDDKVVFGRVRPGLFSGLGSLFSSTPPTITALTRTVNTITRIDESTANALSNQLSGRPLAIFKDVLGIAGKDPSVNTVIDRLAEARLDLVNTANVLTWDIYCDPPDRPGGLPPPENDTPVFEQGAVEALGWGDLIVARETLIDYDVQEISHIENILKNEKKNREHSLNRTIEETFETETTERQESERELETTTRNELQIESEKAIEQEFRIEAGVNTSGRYGLTKVETSLDAGFRRSTREAQNSTTEIAKEIVSKAVERTFKSVRELQRRTVTIETRDKNLHEIDNKQAEGGPEPTAISGIYKWVEKVHEVQLRHYGTRMMVEFRIPEPALSIVGREDEVDVDVEEPVPPWFSAGGIGEGNYLALARLYGAKGIEPPPPPFTNVGFAWSSQPAEGDDENKSEDVLSEYVAIPDDYRPISGEFNVSAHPSKANHFLIRLHIADQHFSKDGDAHFSSHFTLTGGATSGGWPNGVPVSMTAHGHFDKTMSMNITFLCIRRVDALRRWQVATFDKIVEAYERKKQEYDTAVEEARLSAQIDAPVSGGPAAANRRTERVELQKWATKILRRVPFDFDATVSVGSGDKQQAEIDPGRADQQAPLVAFYEEAFEWDNMSYFFYPYFWGRRTAWSRRLSLRSNDPRFEEFLKAGAARVVIPVTPGYEARILYYLANPELPEAERITGSKDLDPAGDPPEEVEETVYNTLWLELALNKNEELALGSGGLNVTNGSTQAVIVESRWEATDRDIGRELYVYGDRYQVANVIDSKTIEFSSPYTGPTDPKAGYATGSVAFGPPWIVKLPTNLVVLNENRDDVRLRTQ